MGLVAPSRPNVPVPEKYVLFIPVTGRSGALTEDMGTYKDIIIPIVFNFKESKNFNARCRNIKSWLLNLEEKKIRMSDDLEVFYKVKNVNVGEIARVMNTMGKFTVEFTCEPFLYVDPYTITIKNNSKIYNEGTFESEPVIKLKGTGDITLTINNKNIILKDITDVTIDSQMKNAYNGNQPLNGKMNGEFPIFKVGENNISWTGNVTKAEIIGNWRYI